MEKERSSLKSRREADQRLAAAEAERDNAGNALEVVGQELREKDALIVKLMRSFEEGEKEARALRQRADGQEQLAAEKEAVQASSEFREVLGLCALCSIKCTGWSIWSDSGLG